MLWPRLDFIPVAGVLVEAISGVAGTLVISTGLSAGALRAWAVLKEFPSDRVERATAAGFAAGAAFGALIVAFDLVLS
jgi:hypothetical protein